MQKNFNQCTELTAGIPFYKEVNFEELKSSINSIVSQTLLPVELHLIQDGPVSERIETLINNYVQSYEWIRHIKIEENQGLPYALNLSILLSSTKYYARMDADDISHIERFEKQIAYMEKNLDVEILGSWAFEFENDPINEKCSLYRVPIDYQEMDKWLHYRNPIIHPSVMFRKKVFAKIGLYNATSKTGAKDLELWIKAFKAKVVVRNLNDPLLYYRCSQVNERRSKMIRTLRQAKVRFQYLTFSPKLNLLKVSSILFRLLPPKIRNWGYKNLRK